MATIINDLTVMEITSITTVVAINSHTSGAIEKLLIAVASIVRGWERYFELIHRFIQYPV